MTPAAVHLRTAAEVAGAAALGLLHAIAAGAVVLAGVGLAAPGVVAVDNAGDAAAQAVAFGLACLRVPLESGDVRGTFAPLGGLAVTLWGLASAVRKQAPRWPGRRAVHVVAVAGAFAAVCAVAAAAAGAAEAEASIDGAALAGAVWGALAAAWAVGSRGTVAEPPASGRGLAGVAARAGSLFGRRGAPGFVALALALGVAAAWFLAAVLVQVAGLPARVVAGGLLLGLVAAPNAAAAFLAVALGGRVDVVLDGTVLLDPVAASVSLWDWAGGIAPPHVLLLVLAPVTATLFGGRVAAAATPRDHPLLRGLRLGAILGAGVVAAGWAGSLAADAGAAGEVSVRLGFEALPVFAVALAWGIAGAWLGPRLPRPRSRGSRVTR